MKSTILIAIAFTLGLVVIPLCNIQACAMTSVIANGTYTLENMDSQLGTLLSSGESHWLYEQGDANPSGHGALFYDKSGLASHDYTILYNAPGTDIDDYDARNHIYRKELNITADLSNMIQFVNNVSNKNGKIFMGHDRLASPNQPSGAYAPFTYRYISQGDTIDFSFAHHGAISKVEMLEHLPELTNWLVSNDHLDMAFNPDGHVDSEYLFYWIICKITACNGDVKMGLKNALTEIKLQTHIYDGNTGSNPPVPPANINIFFSDGTGVYTYTNWQDQETAITLKKHVMSYKKNMVGSNTISYMTRSWDQQPTGWTLNDAHSLYYFPTVGKMQVYPDIDSGSKTAQNFTLQSGYNWVGFPILLGTSSQDPDDALQNVNISALNLETRTPGSNNNTSWSYENNLWNANAILNRTYGYVLNMQISSTPYKYFAYGTKTSENQSLTYYPSYETWVPYLISYSQSPQAAFGNNFGKVTSIRSKDWFAFRDGDTWYTPSNVSLDYGKMYKVTVSEQFSMPWVHFTRMGAYQAPVPEFFTAVEQADYQPVLIDDIAGFTDVEEIGAFKDGVCVGASKVDGYPIFLQVYDDASPQYLDYQVIRNSKSAGSQTLSLSRKNITIRKQNSYDGETAFSVLSLNGSDAVDNNTMPQITDVAYPNPFSSSVSICLSASKDFKSDVSIYNIKGQKVASLFNGTLTKGSHNLKWDGIDSNGTKLSNGIYFYKVNAEKNTLTRKIILVR